MQYDFSPDALFHPETRTPFIGFTEVPTFNPTATCFDPRNAWWLAGAAHLAYYPASLLHGRLRRVGLRLEQTFQQEGTFGFVASGPGFAIVTFRGTRADELPDVVTGIDITLTAFGAGGRVHRGFLRALDQTWEAVESHLAILERRGLRLWYTGHSLGAALATLAAARRAPTALVTFGSPLVGDASFVRGASAFPTYRVVNCCDVVPAVPPPAIGYRHVGEHYFLTSRGRLFINPSPGRVFRSKLRGAARYAVRFPWLRPRMVKLRSLADHAIVNYAAGLHRVVTRETNRGPIPVAGDGVPPPGALP